MVCPICNRADAPLHAVDETLDNFHRFYGQYLEDPPKSLPDHQYQYTRATSEGETRLFTLSPGKGDDPISGTLQYSAIDKPPDYHALSYVWGQTKTKEVEVDGQTFAITDNLWFALWHLRSPIESRRMWIDALCINQDAIEERNATVPRMKDVYENAQEVLAWLGPDGNGGSTALETIHKIYTRLNIVLDRYGSQEAAIQYISSNAGWWDGHQKDRDSTIQNLRYIDWLYTQRTWFYRVWIMQEGTSLTKTTFHLCDQAVPSEAVYNVYDILQRIPTDHFPRNLITGACFSPHDNKINSLRTFARQRAQGLFSLKEESRSTSLPPRLTDVLALLRGHSASDPRDKIYAALGFVQDIPITVDYSKSLSETLKEAAFACLTQSQGISPWRLLGHAGMSASSHVPATWIPDWFSDRGPMPFPKDITAGAEAGKPLFNPSPSDHPIWDKAEYRDLQAHIRPDCVFKVPGILVDYVRSASIGLSGSDHRTSPDTLWMPSERSAIYTPTEETIESAFLQTLVAGINIKDGEIVGRGGSMYLQESEHRPPDYSDCQHLMHQICGSRRIIKTARYQYIGLAPFETLPGDAILMLRGGEVLYIGRPNVDGKYHFVGEAYVHGLMDGAILDALEQGQRTMQWITFAAIESEDQNEPLVEGPPFVGREYNWGYNICRYDLWNPKEDLKGACDNEVTQRVNVIILNALNATIKKANPTTGPNCRLVTEALCGNDWPKLAEEMLLADWKPCSCSFCGEKDGDIPGRDFSRRSYIAEAIARFREELEMARCGHDEDACTRRSNGESNAHSPDNQENQPEDSATSRLITSCTPLRKNKEMRDSDQGYNDLVSLVINETHAPTYFEYHFRKDQQPQEFIEAMDRFEMSDTSYDSRPVLIGKWGTDPTFRPKVTIVTFGNVGKMRWEDEHGRRIPDPDNSWSPSDPRLSCNMDDYGDCVVVSLTKIGQGCNSVVISLTDKVGDLMRKVFKLYVPGKDGTLVKRPEDTSGSWRAFHEQLWQPKAGHCRHSAWRDELLS